jgi:hypothetical protein
MSHINQLAWKYTLGTAILLLALALLINALRVETIALSWRSARAELRYAGVSPIPAPLPTPTPTPGPTWVETPPPLPILPPPPLPLNLVVNPGFEETLPAYPINPGSLPALSDLVPLGWQSDAFREGVVFALDDTQAHSGQQSVRITADNTNDVRWLQTVLVAPHTDYELSGWIKTENVVNGDEPYPVGASLNVMGSMSEHTPGLTGTNDWTYVQLYFNTWGRTEITIACHLGYASGTAMGTMWCDDLTLRPQNP